MYKHKLRFGVVKAAAAGAAAVSAALIVGGGVASAAIPSDPTGGATPVAPHFYNGNVEGIRDTGSDTTFFMMQKIGDLYTSAGLYGCSLNGLAGDSLYNSSDPASVTTNLNFFCKSGANVSTTDVNDNWDRVEVYQGVDSVGSGAGQNQLCGAAATPLPVDFSRSSKPAGTACTGLVGTGYAKDGVDVLTYPVNPTQVGGGVAATAPYTTLNGGVVGPVGNGWLPGDPNTGPFTGTALTSGGIANGAAATTAYELWCATDSTRITDWGQLTNLGPNLEVQGVQLNSGSPTATLASGNFPSTVASGQAITGPNIPGGTTVSSVSGGTLTLSQNASGTATNTVRITTSSTLAVGSGSPIGIPVRIVGVNSASGTEATWASYAEGSVASGGCAANMNTNAASDPNSVTATGDNAGQHIALENNSDQLNQFAVTDFPGDAVSQAIEAATSLYIMSDGVDNTNPFAAATTIGGVGYSGLKVPLNGKLPTTPTKLQNTYPTARTLFNIYRTSSIRASAGGFLNWVCDGNTSFSKNMDNSTGVNFDQELTNTIGTLFGFPRLTDTNPAPAIGTPADGLAAPNNSCAASLAVSTTSGTNTITLTAGGNFPGDIVNGGGITGAGIPTGTTVSSGGGTSTLTLSQNASATATGVSAVFAGVPAVTSVASSQN